MNASERADLAALARVHHLEELREEGVMVDIGRRRADARSLVLSSSLARRVEQLRREAEAFFAEHPAAPDGWRPARSSSHPETIQASHYVAVLARLPKIERAMDRRRYSAALDLYEMAESWAEAARTARRAERTGEVYERATALPGALAREQEALAREREALAAEAQTRQEADALRPLAETEKRRRATQPLANEVKRKQAARRRASYVREAREIRKRYPDPG